MSLTILLTNNSLDARAGSELYIRDIALALLRRGHRPIAYSTKLGIVADELRNASVPVIDRLETVSVKPDIIHGHHHLDALTALMHFPDTPAVSYCHGWLPWEESPLVFPRIGRYIAVDEVCRDRLVLEAAIPEDKISLLFNFVDLNRFRPREEPLPDRPVKAILLSNYAREDEMLKVIRAACKQANIWLDVVGQNFGTGHAIPEKILANYDLSFAKGRSALESMAVGAAVILYDGATLGPLVTSENFDRLRRLNFGIRTRTEPLTYDNLVERIGQYSAADAACVSARIRQEADIESTVDKLLGIYREVIADFQNGPPPDRHAELKAAAAHMKLLPLRTFEMDTMRDDFARQIETIRHLEETLKGERQQAARKNIEHQRALADLTKKLNEATARADELQGRLDASARS